MFFSALALIMLVPCLCQSEGRSSPAAQIGEITATSTKDAVVVNIQIKGSPSRTLFSELSAPSRLVIDFYSATPTSGFKKSVLAQGPVLNARTALFGADRDGNPITRVALDLATATKFTSHLEQGKLVLSANLASPLAKVPVVKATFKAPAAVPTSAPPAIIRELEEMSVSQTGGKTTVRLRLDQPVKPVISLLSDPKRYVMDFPETEFGVEWKHSGTFNLATGPVSSIRVAKFRMNPRVVRLVFDQAENAPKPTLVRADGMLTLTFENSAEGQDRSPVRASRTTEVHPSPALTADSQLHITKQEHAPFVSYDRGMLFVDADNSNLPDILYAISQKTGAQIELPMAEGMLDRVGTRIGPAPPREVIAKLLDGSIYNYIIVESATGKLDEVLLSPKQPANSPTNDCPSCAR